MTPAQLIAEASRLGISLAAVGDKLRVTAPQGALTPELRRALAERKAELMALLVGRASQSTPNPDMEVERSGEKICLCDPLLGPAQVMGVDPCPRCGRPWRCPECGGCRGCHSGDTAETVAARQRVVQDRLLARLRKGHAWLTEVHQRLLEERDVFEGMESLFLQGLDLWVGLDGTLRDVYQYQGCVMPEGRCPDDSPVSCTACAGTWPGPRLCSKCREVIPPGATTLYPATGDEIFCERCARRGE